MLCSLIISFFQFFIRYRWFASIHRVEVLVSAVQHLFSLPTHSYRPAVAAYLYAVFVLPVVQMLILLEQDSDLFTWVSSGQSVRAYTGQSVKVLSDEQVQVCRRFITARLSFLFLRRHMRALLSQTFSSSTLSIFTIIVSSALS